MFDVDNDKARAAWELEGALGGTMNVLAGLWMLGNCPGLKITLCCWVPWLFRLPHAWLPTVWSMCQSALPPGVHPANPAGSTNWQEDGVDAVNGFSFEVRALSIYPRHWRGSSPGEVEAQSAWVGLEPVAQLLE